MSNLKEADKLSQKFINKEKYLKIKKIKDKHERLQLLHTTLISELKSRHLDLELKLKQIDSKKKKHMLSLKLNIIPSKLRFLHATFNEKDFKKIDSLLNKLKEEVESV